MLKNDALIRTNTYVNGNWIRAASGDTIEVINPANGTLLGTVPKLEREEIKLVISAANTAYPAWRQLTAKERAKILHHQQNLHIHIFQKNNPLLSYR